MNLILEKTDQVPFFTNMQFVFNALRLSADCCDWYVSDIETNRCCDGFSSEDQWISGKKLQHFLERNDIQFNWAVFSAFPVGFRMHVQDAPYADGNAGYWNGAEIKPQLEGALFEIAAGTAAPRC